MNDQDQINEDERQEAATETPAFLGCPQHMPAKLPSGFDGTEPSPEERAAQSARDREIARQKRKIRWKVYPTKVDVCTMGRTEQNGKVYEVRIVKRDEDFKETSYQCKVNGKTVLTGVFTGNAWMLNRILTKGMQALVNYKAKKKRDAAAKAAGEVK